MRTVLESDAAGHAGAPLAGITVLDLSRVLSGPFASMTLGDLGATVVKVERPAGDDTRAYPPLREGESHYFLSVNRNKRSVVVDLHQRAGREVVARLARHADVVIENFRPGVASALGLDYEQLSATNERLVYCSISGFGQDGPLAERASFDSVIQALSGMMSINGRPGSPTKVGVPISDLTAGLYATIGVLGALVERAATGRGRWIDVSMLEATMGLLGHVNGQYLMTGLSPAPVGSSHHSIVPYDVYPAADGHLVIAIVTEAFWPRLCRAIGREDLATDARYATNAARVERREEVDALVTACLKSRPLAYWSERFGAEDVPFAPILSVGEALRQPQAVTRGVVRQVEHDSLGATELQGPVIHFPGCAPTALHRPPRLGADTVGVLRELGGYSASELDELLETGAIVQADHAGARADDANPKG